MALIITNQKTLKKIAIILLRNNVGEKDIENYGDLTLIKINGDVVGINIYNYQKHFHAQEGARTLTEEQKQAIEKMGYKIKNDPPFFVVAKILSKRLHPKSNKLYILKLNIGQNKDLQVVSSLENLLIEQKVVVAMNKSILPSGKAVSSSKVMGILSEAMICSEKTLGVGELSKAFIPTQEIGSEFIL